MPRILAFTNNKGGTGKSTLCVNVAHAAALTGQKVLLVDLASQMTSSSLLLGDVSQLPERETILALFTPDPEVEIEDLICVSDKGLDVIPSHLAMAKAVSELVRMEGEKGSVLQQQLQKIQDHYDLILIDSPGDLNELMANALNAAQRILIPSRLNRTDFQCTEATLRFIEDSSALIGRRQVRVVLNMLDPRYLPGGAWSGSHTGQLYQRACETFGDVLSPVTIPDSSDIRTAFDRGLTVMEYRPDAVAAQRIVSLVEREVFHDGF